MKKTYKDELEFEINYILSHPELTDCYTKEEALAYAKRNKGNMVALAEINALLFHKSQENDFTDCDFESMYKLSVSYNNNAPKRTKLYDNLSVLGYYKDENEALATLSERLRYNELLKIKEKDDSEIASKIHNSVAILDYDEISKKGKFGDPNTIFGEFKIEKVTMY